MPRESSSLLDDRAFLEELEQVEPDAVGEKSAHVRERTLDELDHGMAGDRPVYSREGHGFDDATWPETSAPAWIGAPRPQVRWRVAAFLMLMLAGGAVAALVFSDRVAEILDLLR